MTGTSVTATDLTTGESETVTIVNDWNVICDGNVYVDSVQAYGNGTVVITIKREQAK